MRYLLLMTGAGTILFVLYGIWTIIFRHYLDHGMKYKVLKIVLLVHLLPFVGLKNCYIFLLELLAPKQAVQQSKLLVAMANINTASEDYMTPDFKWSILIAVIWAGITVLILLCECIVYLMRRNALNKVVGSCHCEIGAKIVEKLKPCYRIKRPIEVLQIPGKRTPYITGVFKPIIVLPEELDEGDMECALKHELTHIARGDVFFKLILGLACSLYWFNLFLWIFTWIFDKECESSCDERVMNECTEEERNAYVELLRKYMYKDQGENLGIALAKDYDNIKVRIKELKNIRKMKRWQKIVAVSVFAVFMMADSLVALAYPKVYHVNDKKDMVEYSADFVVDAGRVWAYDDEDENRVFEVLYDNEFIGETGKITLVNDIQPNVFCKAHNWVSGYLQSHIKDVNGGCIVYVTEGELCTYCNAFKIESVYVAVDYTICPH